MKSLPWLRLYTEIIDDEKLGLLAFEDRWHFVALLCLKGKGVLDNEPDADMLRRKVALKMGLTCAELEKVASRLSRMGLIHFDTFQPCAWDMRQMQSDTDPTNAQRQHRHRMKNKAVTGDNALRNAEITRKDTDTDTEVDTDKEEEQTHTAAAIDQPEASEQAPMRVSMPGAICMAMKATGIGAVNPSHPDIQALIDKGADIGMFVGAAQEAVKKQKGFAYALGMVKGQMKDAAALAGSALAAPHHAPNKQEALEARNREVARKWAAGE